MFKTHMGPVEDGAATVYLRPETAQGIFINFKNVLQFARVKPPFGIAQVGKSFRNEITPGNFIFRTREFEQMEMEYFVPPDEADQWYRALDRPAACLVRGARDPARLPARPPARRRRALALLVGHQRHRVPVPDRLVRARGNRQSRRLRPDASTRRLRREARVLRPAGGDGVRPARDRARCRRRPRDCSRFWSTPTTPRRSRAASARSCGSIPASRRSRSPCCRWSPRRGCRRRPARCYDALRARLDAEYDEGGSIGKRYRRQDEIGTPWGVTVDGQTLADDTVTLRDRDTLEQVRVPDRGPRRRARRAPRCAVAQPQAGRAARRGSRSP